MLNTSAVQIGAAAIAADINSMSLHTTQPDNTGSNETTAARQAIAPTSVNGVISVGTTNFTGGAANGPVGFIGLWHNTTFRGWEPITGDVSFNSAGQFTIDSVTLTGSAPS